MEKKEEIVQIIQDYKKTDTDNALQFLEESLVEEDWESVLEKRMEEIKSRCKHIECADTIAALLDIRIVLER